MSLFNKCVCLSDEVTTVMFSSQSVFRLGVGKTAVLVLNLSFSVLLDSVEAALRDLSHVSSPEDGG